MKLVIATLVLCTGVFASGLKSEVKETVKEKAAKLVESAKEKTAELKSNDKSEEVKKEASAKLENVKKEAKDLKVNL